MVLIMIYASAVQSCIGARAAGMGHAGVANSTDATAIYWNPAILPWTEPGASIGMVRPLKYDYIAISYKKIGFTYVDEHWGPYTHISVGHQLTPSFSVGCSFGLGLDIDDIWKPYISPAIVWKNDNIIFGILLQTMSNLRPAVSYSTENFILASEFYDVLSYHKSRRLRLGCEYQFYNLFIRYGTEFTDSDIIKNIGFGYKFKNLKIDIAYDTMSKWTYSSSLSI